MFTAFWSSVMTASWIIFWRSLLGRERNEVVGLGTSWVLIVVGVVGD